MRAWEPLEGELRGQGKAWRGFKTFRDMPERSLRGAAGIFYGNSEEGPSQSQYEQFKRWSSRFSWQERVQSHDAWIEMVQRSAIEKHARAHAEDHAKREARLREKSLEVREQALDQSLKMLQWPLVEQRQLHEGEDGEQQTLVFLPARWSKATAVSLYNMALGDASPAEEDDTGELDLSSWSDQDLYHFLELMGKTPPANPRRRPGE